MIITRRKFIIGAATILAAPAIVRAASLMPVRSRVMFDVPVFYTWSGLVDDYDIKLITRKLISSKEMRSEFEWYKATIESDKLVSRHASNP